MLLYRVGSVTRFFQGKLPHPVSKTVKTVKISPKTVKIKALSPKSVQLRSGNFKLPQSAKIDDK